MHANLNEDSLTYLFEAITTLKTVDDCRKFFEDLCTVPELKAMSQRLMVAKMLSEKTVYNKIVAETGASTATISRVNRALNYTSCDGYALVFDRLKNQKKDEE